VRPASPSERARLGETFAALCRIRSPFGEERAIADDVARRLAALGLHVEEDDSAPVSGAGAGNLLARIPGRAERSVVLCAHLDTVPHPGQVEPVLDEDAVWRSAGDTILGADNKAAVAVLLEAARRWTDEGSAPVGVELLFTCAEEDALAGSKAFDARRLRSDLGFVYDQASPIGGVVVASPTAYRLEATFHGRAAHAGLRPEDGRSAILAAARAITHLPHGRIDPETTANVGGIEGGAPGTNIVAERCSFRAEARSLDPARVEDVVARMVDAVHDAANEPVCQADVDLAVEQVFRGYRHGPRASGVLAAEEALARCGHTPARITSGGGTDANALEAQGVHVVCLANGTLRNHEPSEQVAQAALEEMLDVTHALCGVLSGA